MNRNQLLNQTPAPSISGLDGDLNELRAPSEGPTQQKLWTAVIKNRSGQEATLGYHPTSGTLFYTTSANKQFGDQCSIDPDQWKAIIHHLEREDFTVQSRDDLKAKVQIAKWPMAYRLSNSIMPLPT